MQSKVFILKFIKQPKNVPKQTLTEEQTYAVKFGGSPLEERTVDNEEQKCNNFLLSGKVGRGPEIFVFLKKSLSQVILGSH